MRYRMAEEIYYHITDKHGVIYYIIDKHGVIYGRSTSKTRLQEKMKNNFTEADIRKLGIKIVEMYDSI